MTGRLASVAPSSDSFVHVSVCLCCPSVCLVAQADDPCPQSLLSPAQTAAGRYEGGAPRESHSTSARRVISAHASRVSLTIASRLRRFPPRHPPCHYCCCTPLPSRVISHHMLASVQPKPNLLTRSRSPALLMSLLSAKIKHSRSTSRSRFI